jgi:hypothetical protein
MRHYLETLPKATVVIRYQERVIRVVSPCHHEWHDVSDVEREQGYRLCWLCKKGFRW